MKHVIGPGLLAAGMMLTGAAQAETFTIPGEGPPVGKQAGTVMVRLRAIGVIPQDSSSEVKPIGGGIDVTASAAPEIDISYFFTDHIATELIAASTRHEISATKTVLGHVDIGSTWVLPPTITLQYHFLPHERFSPYLGAGLNLTFFYDTSPAEPTVTKFGLSNNVGAAIQAGFDYNITGHWFLNFDVKQIFVRTTARLNGGAIKASTSLNPTVIGAGIGYRF
ncbi:MAG: OmpW family protein [Acetobacteraceae bacterium]|nr:OmpW family protein [Acetobacteraceae bacterium]MBV8525784.1 OmpW family protein [Acetobacteraceae bacterium]MBV8591716.1 OmpW family protein [Acetobacteraceae bacterium]